MSVSADGTLIIILCRARNLPNHRRLEKQNPYVLLRMGNVLQRSPYDFRGGQTPEWNHECRFTLSRDRPPVLRLDVLDDVRNLDPTPIGLVEIDCAPVFAPSQGPQGEPQYIYDSWFDLTLGGRPAGSIRLEMTLYPSAPPLPGKRFVPEMEPLVPEEQMRRLAPIRLQFVPKGTSMAKSSVVDNLFDSKQGDGKSFWKKLTMPTEKVVKRKDEAPLQTAPPSNPGSQSSSVFYTPGTSQLLSRQGDPLYDLLQLLERQVYELQQEPLVGYSRANSSDQVPVIPPKSSVSRYQRQSWDGGRPHAVRPSSGSGMGSYGSGSYGSGLHGSGSYQGSQGLHPSTYHTAHTSTNLLNVILGLPGSNAKMASTPSLQHQSTFQQEYPSALSPPQATPSHRPMSHSPEHSAPSIMQLRLSKPAPRRKPPPGSSPELGSSPFVDLVVSTIPYSADDIGRAPQHAHPSVMSHQHAHPSVMSHQHAHPSVMLAGSNPIYFMDQQLSHGARAPAVDDYDPSAYAPTPQEFLLHREGRIALGDDSVRREDLRVDGGSVGYLGNGQWNHRTLEEEGFGSYAEPERFSPLRFNRPSVPSVPPKVPLGMTDQEYYVLEKSNR